MPKTLIDLPGLAYVFSRIKSLVAATAATKADISLSNVEAADWREKGDEAMIIHTAGDGYEYTAEVPGITALTAGVSFIMVPHTVSTIETPTLNVNGLGAKNLRQPLTINTGATTAAATAAWLVAGMPVKVMYDGTQWRTVDIPRPSATNLYGIVPVTGGGTGAKTPAAARENLGIKSGTWTPELDGISEYVSRSGRWYQVGNFVTLLFHIRVSKDKSTAAADTVISVSGFADQCGAIALDAGGNGLFNAGGLAGQPFAGFFGAAGETSFGPRRINDGGALDMVTFGSDVLTIIDGSLTYYNALKEEDGATSDPKA